MGELELYGEGQALQVKAERRDGFTKARRLRFLEALAATCNVRLSARITGINVTSVYARRRRDPEFEGQWRAAILAAYERLETALMARALGTDAPVAADCDFGDPEDILAEAKIDAELAFKLLNRHRATAEGRGRPIRPGRHIATEEETNAALLKQLAVLRRRIEKSGGAILVAPEPAVVLEHEP